MTIEQLKEKQAAMSNDNLIALAKAQITELAGSGGRSHKMCVPPEVTDTDMLFSELVKRFEMALTLLTLKTR